MTDRQLGDNDMKENVVDLLVYLFQNYINASDSESSDRDSVQHELLEAGFQDLEIKHAFDWLEGLAQYAESEQTQSEGNSDFSFRIYTEQERLRLETECQGYLLFLEQAGILDYQTRELVIDRVMALQADDFDLQQLKWILLMVLFNQPGQEEAYAWLEDQVFEADVIEYLH